MAEVLVIHNQVHVKQSLLEHVRRSGHTVLSMSHLSEACALTNAASTEYAVILLGVRKGGHSADAVECIKSEWPTATIVAIGASVDVCEAIAALKHGTLDYVTAASDPAALIEVVHRGSESSGGTGAVRSNGQRSEMEDLFFQDAAMQAVLKNAKRAAAVSSTILITGETGTGKEVVARWIHRHGTRRAFKFVPVNCGSLPDTLIETELFGYKRGAFTGAMSNSKGLIVEAEGGVLFLDEIGDMPLSMQVKLLRFLDRGEIRPVGDTCARHVDVRVIAATNRSLAADVLDGRFRQDLLFRLSVLSLHLPPLRERRGDMRGLIHHHLARVAAKLGAHTPLVSNEAMSILERYSWPGNVRELQNALEHALIHQSTGIVTAPDLPASVAQGSESPAVARYGRKDQREDLTNLLRRHGGNHTDTAAALGISRSTLWRRLRRPSDAGD